MREEHKRFFRTLELSGEAPPKTEVKAEEEEAWEPPRYKAPPRLYFWKCPVCDGEAYNIDQASVGSPCDKCTEAASRMLVPEAVTTHGLPSDEAESADSVAQALVAPDEETL